MVFLVELMILEVRSSEVLDFRPALGLGGTPLLRDPEVLNFRPALGLGGTPLLRDPEVLDFRPALGLGGTLLLLVLDFRPVLGLGAGGTLLLLDPTLFKFFGRSSSVSSRFHQEFLFLMVSGLFGDVRLFLRIPGLAILDVFSTKPFFVFPGVPGVVLGGGGGLGLKPIFYAVCVV